jgi:hypothetical protein
MFLKVIAWLGVAFLIAAGYFCIQAIREKALNLQPLVLPVSLVPGTIRTPEFKTDIDYWDYEIAIDFETKVDRQRMDCFLGGEANPARCKGIPNLIDISWELFEGERVASKGNSGNTPGMTWEPAILYERTIGIFRAQKMHKYSLVLHVNRDASDLNIANPKIVVQILRGYWVDHAMGIGFYELLATVSGLMGGILIFPTVLRWITRRRQPNTPAT